MDNSIEWRGRFRYFVESSGGCNVWDDAKVELGASSWEIGQHLFGFRLGSDDCTHGEAASEELLEDVGAHEAVGAGKKDSLNHDCRIRL
jgi:hypothetical protein